MFTRASDFSGHSVSSTDGLFGRRLHVFTRSSVDSLNSTQVDTALIGAYKDDDNGLFR